MQISDLTGISKPLTRLIEVISNGIGAVFKPYLIRKTAEARADEIGIIATALNEVAEKHQLLAVYKDGKVEVWNGPDDKSIELNEIELNQRMLKRIDYQERKRQKNIENITSIAANELSHETDVPEQKPDEDWTTRFFSSAQDISSEEMQELWGRILAGEIKKPGSYSLRTIDFVRNITKAEAEIFERLGCLALRVKGTSAVF